MPFAPPKLRGLIIGGGLGLLLLGLDYGLLTYLFAAPITGLSFLAGCLVLASLPTLGGIIYRCASLARARYILDYKSLSVEWGGRREVMPLQLIRELKAGSDVAEKLRPRGLTWPGCVVGQAEGTSLGEVDFQATTPQAKWVLVNYDEAWLAISPADPFTFVAAFNEARAGGTTVTVPPLSIRPAWELWPIWRDRLALALIAVGGAGALLLVGYLTLIYPQLQPLPQIALHFNAQGQADFFGAPFRLFWLPTVAGLIWLFNTFVGALLHYRERERPGAYLLFGATAFVTCLIWIATLSLLTAGE